MRKIITVSILTFFFATGFAAKALTNTGNPSSSDNGFSVGLRAGVNVASEISTDPGDNVYNSVPLLTFGGALEGPLSQSVSFRSEFSFIQKGTLLTGPDTQKKTIVEETLVFNQIELGALAKVSFGNGAVKGFLIAGPTLGYIINGFATVDDVREKIDKAYFNPFEIGIQIGGGIAVEAGPGHINFDARYGAGLTSIDKLNNTLSSVGVILSVGYMLSIGN